MAITGNEVQVQWNSGSNYYSISASGNYTSDVANLNTAAFDGMIELKADNDGTPASGDTVDFYIQYTSGDPDGSGSDEYDTDEHSIFLAQLDTNVEDPAITHVPVNTAADHFQVYAVNNSSGRAITVSATMTEKRG